MVYVTRDYQVFIHLEELRFIQYYQELDQKERQQIQ